MELVELFDVIGDDLVQLGLAERNPRGSLVVGGSVRAMTSKGRIIVKLSASETAELVAAGVGSHYKGQRNRWLELAPELERARVEELVERSIVDNTL